MPVVKSIQSRNAAAQRAERARIYHHPRWRAPGGTRSTVLTRDPNCVLCGAPSTIADHHPHPLRTLLTNNLDPFDPTTCRGLCHHCSGTTDGGGAA